MNKVLELLGKAESWLDSKGRPAWIATMVLGFVFVWPVGLAILFYMLWSGRMRCGKGGWSRKYRKCGRAGATGNSAFDEYREETIRRLEDERAAFVDFLDKLRKSKDKAEFDQFMAGRSPGNGNQTPATA